MPHVLTSRVVSPVTIGLHGLPIRYDSSGSIPGYFCQKGSKEKRRTEVRLFGLFLIRSEVYGKAVLSRGGPAVYHTAELITSQFLTVVTGWSGSVPNRSHTPDI